MHKGAPVKRMLQELTMKFFMTQYKAKALAYLSEKYEHLTPWSWEPHPRKPVKKTFSWTALE